MEKLTDDKSTASIMKSKTQIFIGTGGVGKTTLSSLYALKLSRMYPEKKIKLITIDPSERLRDYFGMSIGESSKTISNLTVAINSREALLKDFVLNAYEGHLSEVEKVYENKIFKKVIGGLAVSQEFTSLYELERNHASQFDLIVVDTPPLQNAGSFLSGAESLKGLFSSSFTKFFTKHESGGLFSALFYRARQKGLDFLSRLTGSSFVGELAEFFLVVERLQPKILEVLKSAEEILSRHSDLVCVCNYNELSLAGLHVSLKSLSKQKLNTNLCLVNKYRINNGELGGGLNVEKRMEKLKKAYPTAEIRKVKSLNKAPSSYEDLLEAVDYVEF